MSKRHKRQTRRKGDVYRAEQIRQAMQKRWRECLQDVGLDPDGSDAGPVTDPGECEAIHEYVFRAVNSERLDARSIARLIAAGWPEADLRDCERFEARYSRERDSLIFPVDWNAGSVLELRRYRTGFLWHVHTLFMLDYPPDGVPWVA